MQNFIHPQDCSQAADIRIQNNIDNGMNGSHVAAPPPWSVLYNIKHLTLCPQDSGNSISYEDSIISQTEETTDQPPHTKSESNATLSVDNNIFDASTLENYEKFIQNVIKYENSNNFYMARDYYDKAINFIQNDNKFVGDWKVKLLRLEKVERDNGSGGGASYRKSSRGDTYRSRGGDGKRSRRNRINGNGGDDSKSNKKDKAPWADSTFPSRLEVDIVANLA